MGNIQPCKPKNPRAASKNKPFRPPSLPLPSQTYTQAATAPPPPPNRPRTATPYTPPPTPITPLSIGQGFAALPQGANPLTGLAPLDPVGLQRRPLAVKITTFPRSVRAYQSGLTRADVVYEYYIEDGLTRFIAVFWSQDAERAGPVRSGRYFDEHIMRMYQAILVFANADERVENHLLESDQRSMLFVPRPDNCPPLCRDETITGYNNLFVNTGGVGDHVSDNLPPALRTSTFGPLLAPISQRNVGQVYLHYSIYSYGYWQYDASQNAYLRFSDAQDASAFGSGEVYQPHIDHLNGKQLTAQNVVVLVVPHNFNNEFDRADQVFNIHLLNSGVAYLFRNGQMVQGQWQRDALNQPIRLLDQRGNPLALQPGITYYQVMNLESTLLQNEDSAHFYFSIPPRVVTLTPTPPGFNPTPTPKKKR